MIVRPATLADVPAMTALLNRIIAIGGTTAHEQPFSEASVHHHYVEGPALICGFVAEADGLLGFQAVGVNPDLPAGWGDIGTFVDTDRQRSGAGAALFAATCAASRAAGLIALNATIRADNIPGLGFYGRRGFVDYAHDPDYALKSGQVVGRISRRFDL
ncbi:GNAT family N-acetyltransferase [Gemmobacter serpentinus]|uniref:GNAT family N-acetyltransferase n=1 Tax=Gemmobacter serpentinus TaxID=2652247 RepID=UPI00124D5FC2|nr:GNAT family N-acetyltransferase [Gemmobacter serpentinus]